MATLKIDPKSPLHKQLMDRISSRVKFAEKSHVDREVRWQKAEEVTLAYLPQTDEDAIRQQKRDNDGVPQYTTIQIPYTFAILMSAHTYVSSVFLSRTPIHQYTGRHGETEQQTQALEALIGYQVDVGEMLAPYYVWFYDALKYGCGIIGEYWEKQTLSIGEIIELEDETGKVQKVKTVKEIEGYEGNKCYNVSPYDFFHDPRVPIGRFQDGEFCSVIRRLSWTQILCRQRQGYYTNVDLLKDHKGAPPPRKGSSQLIRPEDRDYISEGEEDQKDEHPAESYFYEVYVNLVPSEWGLGNTDYPMMWVFTITYDRGLIVGAQPLGALHCKFPFSVLEAEVEGYGLYSRGIPDIMEPLQQTMDWLLNSHFYNVRAALNNQFIMDPSKIVVEDAEDGGPGFRYRLRPEAFGQDIKTFFHQVEVQDVTRPHMQDLQAMLGMGERVIGINDQVMGALGGTTRRTATEVRSSTGFAVNRQKTIAEYMSAGGFAQHSQRLVQNSQQYYSTEKKFKVIGDLVLEAGQAFVDVNPELIAGNYSFVSVDGTLPVDRMAQANIFKEILANIRNYPVIAQTYDISRIFAWTCQLAGLKNMNKFKIQVLGPGMAPSPGAMPMGPAPTGVQPGNSASTAAGLNALVEPGGGDNG